ncbi:Uncharacterised protein [Mycolicibacterium flavescens]|uniref:hypothetical protein n=1 Tax=Mycobacterium neumannii TaxID=2048551 RepID=UPI000B93EF17|nr:hypothetical protein [Mycobacterium neumannii]VEG40295.1 Uncharacterised protein [Mycolicibacterium flavescens]
MSYQDELIALADSSDRTVQVLYALYLSGELSVQDAVALMAAAVAQANSQAYALADLSLAASIMLGTAEAVPVVGVLPPADDTVRLSKAATTVLKVAEASDVPEAIVSRLARSEPLESATKAFGEAMHQQPLVKGWVRQLDADPCQLCRWWWREGRVWPAAHPMPRHKGCECVQRPVLAQNIQSTGFTRRLERNARAS